MDRKEALLVLVSTTLPVCMQLQGRGVSEPTTSMGDPTVRVATEWAKAALEAIEKEAGGFDQ